MHTLLVILLLSVIITFGGGCTYSYPAPRAIIEIQANDDKTLVKAIELSDSFAKETGFTALRINTASQLSNVDENLRDLLTHTYDYQLKSLSLTLSIVDYSSPERRRRFKREGAASPSMIEVNLYQDRAEGFNEEGFKVFEALRDRLSNHFGDKVKIVRVPAVAEDEHIAIGFTKAVTDVLIRLPFWALFSTPLFIGLFIAGRRLRKRGDTLPQTRIFLGIFSALLLFPMPVGMFLAFIPNAFFFFGGPENYIKLWKWAAISFPITVVISCIVTWLWLRPPNKLFEPTP